MATQTDYDSIPIGFYLLRVLHESTGKHSDHLALKTHSGAWHEQPSVPYFSAQASFNSCKEFWIWAEKNLPIYELPMPVKAA